MLLDDVMQFDGPLTHECMGFRYVTLTHGGVKAEAEPFPGGLCDTEMEAWTKFFRHLIVFTEGARQIAWRRHPKTETCDGKFAVSARLARYPGGLS